MPILDMLIQPSWLHDFLFRWWVGTEFALLTSMIVALVVPDVIPFVRFIDERAGNILLNPCTTTILIPDAIYTNA